LKKIFQQNLETDAFNKALKGSDSLEQSFIEEFGDQMSIPILIDIPIPI
jgi:hypothetical protein